MTEMTKDARRQLDLYLRSLRSCLSGAASVDVAEVERDVRDHVQRELGEAREPVGWTRMQRVLERLGNPIQWVREDELSWKRRTLLRLRHGPEDWRLAYASLGAFLLAGWVAFTVGAPPALLLGLAAFVAARASLAAHAECGEEAGAQLWLLSPALLAASMLGAAALLLVPVLPILELADQIVRLEAIKPRFPGRVHDVALRIQAVSQGSHDLSQTGVDLLKAGPWIPAAMGVWWLSLGLAVRLGCAPLMWAFKPFLGRHRSVLGWSVAWLGVLSLVAATGLAVAKHVSFKGVVI